VRSPSGPLNLRDLGRHLRRQPSSHECTYRHEICATPCPPPSRQIARPTRTFNSQGSFFPVALALLAVWSCTPTWTGSIGANLGQSKADGRLTVRETPPTLAAYRAGLREGDEIVSIDGHDTAGMSATEVHTALSGKVGSRVTVVVRRGDETLRYEVERGPYVGK